MDVQLDLNDQKTGSGRYFGCFLGSGGVSWGHGLVPHPQVLRMGWAEAEKLVCVRILRIYD